MCAPTGLATCLLWSKVTRQVKASRSSESRPHDRSSWSPAHRLAVRGRGRGHRRLAASPSPAPTAPTPPPPTRRCSPPRWTAWSSRYGLRRPRRGGRVRRRGGPQAQPRLQPRPRDRARLTPRPAHPRLRHPAGLRHRAAGRDRRRQQDRPRPDRLRDRGRRRHRERRAARRQRRAARILLAARRREVGRRPPQGARADPAPATSSPTSRATPNRAPVCPWASTPRVTARAWGVTREAQDELAAASHQRLAAAYERGLLRRPRRPFRGLARDQNLRPDSTVRETGPAEAGVRRRRPRTRP